MSVLVPVDSTKEPRSWSLGPVKCQVMTYAAVSGDVSASFAADQLTTIFHVIVDGGIKLTAAPSFSGNAITLAFTDPAASNYGTILIVGR